MDDDERNVCRSTDDDNNHQKLEEVVLPGFRFHPTDEELVGFYLKRKIQQRPLSIELIKQLDIYKHDPWDLPKLATTGEKEWYFYCPRDRKYRNSSRPNRVTGAGFWKATGTDRPIYSSEGSNSSKCIGLKKSLVFYKGRAAKGVKTDWMMHEFRLPSHDGHHHHHHHNHHHHPSSSPKRSFHLPKTPNVQDAWAICRIFKKTTSTGQRALSHSWVSTSIPQHHHHQIRSRQDDQSNDNNSNVNCVPSPADHDHILMDVMNANPKNMDHHQLQHNIPTTAPPPSMADFSSYKLINQYLSLNTAAAGDLASLIFSSSCSPIHFSNNTCSTSTGDGGGSSSSLVSSSFSHDNIGSCESSSLQLGNIINLNHLADHNDHEWIQAVRSNPGFPFGFPLIGLGDSWKPNLMWELD